MSENNSRLTRAKKWFAKAQIKEDLWEKFIFSYIAYEILWKLLELDKYRLNGEIKEDFLKESPHKDRKELKKLLDQRPLKNKKYPNKTVKLENENDFDNILRFINYTRNNLFHGDKEFENSRDISIVTFSVNLLKPLIEVILEYAIKHNE